jgi:hypothetical protein
MTSGTPQLNGWCRRGWDQLEAVPSKSSHYLLWPKLRQPALTDESGG